VARLSQQHGQGDTVSAREAQVPAAAAGSGQRAAASSIMMSKSPDSWNSRSRRIFTNGLPIARAWQHDKVATGHGAAPCNPINASYRLFRPVLSDPMAGLHHGSPACSHRQLDSPADGGWAGPSGTRSQGTSARAVLLPLEVGLQRACVACQPSKGKKAQGSQGGAIAKGVSERSKLGPVIEEYVKIRPGPATPGASSVKVWLIRCAEWLPRHFP